MSGELVIAVVVFLASAAAVWVLGAGLSKYGDALADLTGLGRLFVGSILVALATSLPELSTNISAVRLNPPNPDLAVGNVLGANMLDLFIFAMVALLFGGQRFLKQIAPEQGYLIVLAAAMTGLAVVFGALKLDVGYWKVGLSSVLLLVVYVVGMWVVYQKRPQRGSLRGWSGSLGGQRSRAGKRALDDTGAGLVDVFPGFLRGDRSGHIPGVEHRPHRRHNRRGVKHTGNSRGLGDNHPARTLGRRRRGAHGSG